MSRVNLRSLAFHLLVPLMLSFIVTMIVADYSAYYKTLEKPLFDMPKVIMTSISSLMYLLMGIAAYFVENTFIYPDGVTIDEGKKRKAYDSYFAQLLVFLLYTPVLFGLRRLFLGFLLTIVLVILVFLTYKRFKGISKASGNLLIPYIIWSFFLTFYTLGIWLMNSDIL